MTADSMDLATLAREVGALDQALRDAARLETERTRRLEAAIAATGEHASASVAGLRRERELITHAQHEALAKAETAAERRFESINEFRAQLADQAATFLPRETYETTVAEWTRWREEVARYMSEGRGGKLESRESRKAWQARVGLWVAVLGLALTSVGELVGVVVLLGR